MIKLEQLKSFFENELYYIDAEIERLQFRRDEIKRSQKACEFEYTGETKAHKKVQKEWTEDMLEDFRNATDTQKDYLISRWGEPPKEAFI